MKWPKWLRLPVSSTRHDNLYESMCHSIKVKMVELDICRKARVQQAVVNAELHQRLHRLACENEKLLKQLRPEYQPPSETTPPTPKE